MLRYKKGRNVVPHLIRTNNGPPALTGHFLVDVLPQSSLPSGEERLVAYGQNRSFVSLGLQMISRPWQHSSVGVTHSPPMSVPPVGRFTARTTELPTLSLAYLRCLRSLPVTGSSGLALASPA